MSFTLQRDSTGVPVAAYNKTEDLLKVCSMQNKWRDDFPGSALGPGWQLIQTGSGHTVQVSGSALQILTGTAINSETIIRSVQTFTVPFRVMFIFYITQRIANQEFYLEITNAAGTMLAQWLYDGTSATTGKHNSANAGTAGTAASVTITTTASYAVAELELFPDEAYFHSRAADSSSTRTSSAVRTRLIPDPNDLYYIQIRARNLSAAPASSTTLFLDAVTVQDIAELTAEITAGRGAVVGSQAIAAQVVGGSVSVSGSLSSAGTVSQSTASSLRAALGTATSGGAIAWSAVAVTTTTQTIKSSAGQVYGFSFYNPNASVAWVQMHNTTTITPGTTVPLYSIPVPPSGHTTVFSSVGIAHSTAIALICTTTARGSTAPGTGLDVNVFYA